MNLSSLKTGCLLIGCILLLSKPCLAQITADSSVADSLSISFAPDSNTTISEPQDDIIDAPIYYWTDNGSVSRQGNRMFLTGNSKISYQDMTLEAEKIMIDQENHYLFAEGVVLDSLDSLGNQIIKGTPVFSEKGQEPIKGNTIYYDFQTKRGKIRYGKTEMSPGYYKGERIDKIGKKTLLVEDGYFTSCEFIDHPHFYFKSSKMRVLMEEEIVAKPVYFYIADIPLFVIPYGVFPSKSGRRSGIMIPSYGESTYGGRFLKNIGYYWAPNDYLDATFTADFYDKLGFTYNGDLNYTVRYKLNGRISGFYFPKDPNSGQNKKRWAIRFNHKHNIDPTLTINASGQFQSDQNLAKDLASDVRERTNQLLTSNFTVNKSFPGTKNSMSLNIGLTENLNTGQKDYTLPNLRFSRSQSTIIETFTGKTLASKKAWYENVYFSYNGNLLHRGSERPLNDSLNTVEYSQKEGVEHRISLNSPNKILKYFNITPSLNYNETWVSQITMPMGFDSTNNSLITEEQQTFAARRTFNASVGLKTTIYGMLEPNIGSLKSIRHKMDPQISYTISPDFSTPGYGYFTYITDAQGNTKKVDKFSKNPFSSTPTRRSEKMNISLANLFQGKVVSGEEEKKIDLFVLNFNSGYDFAADSMRWDEIRTNFRSTPLQGINLNLSAEHSLYMRAPSGRGFINKSVVSAGALPVLRRVTASTAFSVDNKMFSIEKEESEDTSGETGEGINDDEGILQTESLRVEKLSDVDAAKNLQIPWRINFSLNYSLDRNDINNINQRIDMGTTASVSLTKNWRINWTARFDLVKKEITYQSFSIYRDLHCWEMSFNWQPSFGYYSFQINVKESILKDIKVTKHPSGKAYY